jgi:hypothetical protein
MEGVEFGDAAGGNRSGGSNGKGAAAYRLPLYLDDWVNQVCLFSGRYCCVRFFYVVIDRAICCAP